MGLTKNCNLIVQNEGGGVSDYLNNVKKTAKFVLCIVRAPSTAGLGGAKTSTTKPPPTELEDEDNIWGGLDPSK